LSDHLKNKTFFVSSQQNIKTMFSVLLFISGGEIFVILLAILLFFGADKIPEFARMMGKGVREFKKATDDIKRELDSGSAGISGVMDDLKSIRDDFSNTIQKEISAPVQDTVNKTVAEVEAFQDPYSHDYFYDNKDYNETKPNEYTTAMGNDAPAEPITSDKTLEAALSETTSDVSQNTEA
jgi:TatA/E family protein of Tat protein translocase